MAGAAGIEGGLGTGRAAAGCGEEREAASGRGPRVMIPSVPVHRRCAARGMVFVLFAPFFLFLFRCCLLDGNIFSCPSTENVRICHRKYVPLRRVWKDFKVNKLKLISFPVPCYIRTVFHFSNTKSYEV